MARSFKMENLPMGTLKCFKGFTYVITQEKPEQVGRVTGKNRLPSENEQVARVGPTSYIFVLVNENLRAEILGFQLAAKPGKTWGGLPIYDSFSYPTSYE